MGTLGGKGLPLEAKDQNLLRKMPKMSKETGYTSKFNLIVKGKIYRTVPTVNRVENKIN